MKQNGRSVQETEHYLQRYFQLKPAQIYKLLNQNSLSDVQESLRLDMSQNIGVYDPVMLFFANSFSAPVPPTVTEIKVFMVSHGLCKNVSWWRLVYSLYISAVKWLIAINRIQNKSFCAHNICVYCVYLLRIYKYTHVCVCLRKICCLYIKYIYI